MKKKMIVFSSILVIFLIVALGFLYYYPRNVSFELTMEIQKPFSKFDNSQCLGFDYVESKDVLIYWLLEHYKSFYPQEQGYHPAFVRNIAKRLDFQKYDYIITYQKKLNALKHSPYLTKLEDNLYFDKKTPLIPTWDSTITDKIYIYKIKKNRKFRAFGP